MKRMAEPTTTVERPRTAEQARILDPLVRTHLRWGWWSLFAYLLMGILLETLHGFKVNFYLDVTHSTRRLMWTLSHAHGTLLGLMNLGLAASLHELRFTARGRTAASRCLVGASVLLPAGFFAGGAFCYDGDPGLGILLVPVGALLLLVSVFLTARAAGR